jgi:hypothetical protein
MMEVWAEVKDDDGNIVVDEKGKHVLKRITSYHDNLFRQVRGWHKGMTFKPDGLTSYMG